MQQDSDMVVESVKMCKLTAGLHWYTQVKIVLFYVEGKCLLFDT